MTQGTQPGDTGPDDGAKSDWRNAETFRQGEPYGGSTPDDAPSAAGRAPSAPDGRLRRLMVAGVSMLAVSAVLRLIGASGFWAFLAGVALFAAILFWPTRSGSGRPSAGRRTIPAIPGVDTARVQEDLDKAEAELAALDAAARSLDRRAVSGAIRRFTGKSREVLDEIARDPTDAERSRKFLVVILPSARRSAEKFIETGVKDTELDGRFEALMGDLEAAAAKQLETLRLDEKLDLEVEMEVLADRLKSGG